MFLIQTRINKLRGKVENNMPTDIKLSKTQINKLIKESGALGSILARFLPKLTKPAISLGKIILAPLGLSSPCQLLMLQFKKKFIVMEQKQ